MFYSILASLNLPAAIEDVSGTDVPSSVKEKAQKIQELGGLTALNALIAELPELLSRNRDILDEVCTVSSTLHIHRVSILFLMYSLC